LIEILDVTEKLEYIFDVYMLVGFFSMRKLSVKAKRLIDIPK
jgi:hypothetical protein